MPENTAISIRNLTKVYKTSKLSSKGDIAAIRNLNLDVPKTGIFVLLGSNGCVPSPIEPRYKYDPNVNIALVNQPHCP